MVYYSLGSRVWYRSLNENVHLRDVLEVLPVFGGNAALCLCLRRQRDPGLTGQLIHGVSADGDAVWAQREAAKEALDVHLSSVPWKSHQFHQLWLIVTRLGRRDLLDLRLLVSDGRLLSVLLTITGILAIYRLVPRLRLRLRVGLSGLRVLWVSWRLRRLLLRRLLLRCRLLRRRLLIPRAHELQRDRSAFRSTSTR